MKLRLYSIFYIIVIAVSACTSSTSETTRIHGCIVGGIDNSVTVYVLDYGIRESIEISNGSFIYELKTNPAIVATFTCMIDGRRIDQTLIPDGSDLTLVFSLDGVSLKSSDKKSINYKLMEIDQVYHEWVGFNSQYRLTQQISSNKSKLDSLSEIECQVYEKLQALYFENLKNNKDNYLSVQSLIALEADFSDIQKDSLIHTLDSAVIQTARIQKILKNIQRRTCSREGMPFVDFCVDTEDGIVSLSDYVGKGNYVIADFWASWCQPCIEEMSHLKELYNQFNGTNIIILGIAVADKLENSRNAIRKYVLPWEQILDTGNIALDAYGIQSIPYIILFGPDGTILRRGVRGDEIDRALADTKYSFLYE